MEKKNLNEIIEKLKTIKILEEFDLVVGIARGGYVPGFLVSQYINRPLEIIHLNLRNDEHEMIRDEAILLKEINFLYKDMRILLVDDVSRSGNTFKKAKELLIGAKYIKTLVFNGDADYSVYNEECFIFPWLIK